MKNPHDELATLSLGLRKRLEWEERRRGKTHLALPSGMTPPRAAAADRPAPEPTPAPARSRAAEKRAAAATAPAAKRASRPAPPGKRAAARPAPPAGRGKKLPVIEVEPPSAGYDARFQQLSALAGEASGCQKCDLCDTRTQVVFARGRARNRVMFIGEAPGANEDAQGLPFVGRAGQLLDQILDATGFQRDEVYIANILKCRPPNNRDPRPEEIVQCTPYLEAQIDLVQPRIICALGKFAAQFLTGNPGAAMGKLRGRLLMYKDRVPVLPTYHPAALLRNSHWKRVVWEDMQLLRKEYLKES